MARMFRCKHCGNLVKRNPRIKGSQRYCWQTECQQARKNTWELVKNGTSESYRDRRKASKNRWRKQHSAHLYQSQYRENHPDYVADNREKQQKRNENRKKVNQRTKIVKTDTFTSERPLDSGIYSLLPLDNNSVEKIVKTDALMVQLTVLQDNTTLSQQQLPVL